MAARGGSGPNSIPPLVGHSQIRRRLATAADEASLHHAYLFEGPPGLGKRRVAQWLASYANCLADARRPCGTCSACIQIHAGTHPDVLVVEPDPKRASRTIAVDTVREVLRQAGYHRFGSRRRFVIIDPAGAMADPAANALLKTLEEPPEGTGFILIATSASRLLPTIVSRCQRVRFGAVPVDEIAGWLHTQGIADPAAAAAMAQGCPGRALDLADGGLERRVGARDAVLALADGNTSGRFAANEKRVKGRAKATWSKDVDELMDVLEEMLRDATLAATGSDLPRLHQGEFAEDWGRLLWPGGIERMGLALSDARDQLELNVSGRLVLDALFARLATELHA